MFIHIVRFGETLYDIASMYNVSVERLISDNGILEPDNLVTGQAIVVLIPETIHTVTSGETLQSIASQYGVTEIELLQNNPFLTSQPLLFAGQELVISFADEKLRTVLVNSYAYPNIDELVLEYALPFLTQLTIFGYGFRRNGELVTINDEEMISKAYSFNVAPIMLLSTVDEIGHFNSETVKYIFSDQEIQDNLIENVLATMKEKGYLGLDIDFEFIEPESKQQYIDFIVNITNRLHAEGFTVNVDLAPKTSAEQVGLLYEAHDYEAIGNIVDTVLVMTYEWGYTYPQPRYR
ncbi:MAG: LysM peptidoglycan-binding domain-containing protein [Clostridiales bacterium]|nr:LysM peptidoglycan-binding domain-containing protein [Clostridiales bacterium]